MTPRSRARERLRALVAASAAAAATAGCAKKARDAYDEERPFHASDPVPDPARCEIRDQPRAIWKRGDAGTAVLHVFVPTNGANATVEAEPRLEVRYGGVGLYGRELHVEVAPPPDVHSLKLVARVHEGPDATPCERTIMVTWRSTADGSPVDIVATEPERRR